MSSNPFTTTATATTVTTAATTGGQFRSGRIIRLDEEEREILRKLGEGSDGHDQKVRHVTRMRPNKVNKVEIFDDDKKTILKVGNKIEKLESKKSFEDLNESAEKFIQKFKQQLILQRLESMENFDKMLARGL